MPAIDTSRKRPRDLQVLCIPGVDLIQAGVARALEVLARHGPLPVLLFSTVGIRQWSRGRLLRVDRRERGNDCHSNAARAERRFEHLLTRTLPVKPLRVSA